MKEIELTHGKVALVDDEDYEWLNQWKWYHATDVHGRKSGYAARRVFVKDGSGKSSIVFMHHLLLPKQNGRQVDHCNGIGTDNRRSNLRYCTITQNNHNLPSHRGGTSQYKGVCWSPVKKKWRANICIERRQTHLGYFYSEIDAAIAYNKAAEQYYGEFARLNQVEHLIVPPFA